MFKAKTKGIHFALAAAFISGVSIFINKFAVNAITPTILFTATKNVGVALLIFGLLLTTKKTKQIKKLSKKEVAILISIGIVGGSIPFYLFFTGLSQIPAVNTALLHKTLVFWVAILAIPFLKEKLTSIQIFSVILIFLGNLTIGGFNGFNYSQPELFVIIATILWAFENILAKKILPTVDPDIVTAARMGLGSFILLTISEVTNPGSLQSILDLSATQVFWITVTIVTLLGYVTSWYRALKFAPAIAVSSILASATLVTNILSAIFITHSLNSEVVIQSALISAGVAIFVRSYKSFPAVKPASAYKEV